MKAIEARLRREIGLDAASVGTSLIERTIRLRMKGLGVETPEAYLALLLTSRSEWEELIEAVVVSETWFFRDAAAFTEGVRWVQSESAGHSGAGPVRVLCVPCASGEEPYSLAMALLDAGVPPERFALHAVDLSARALARAGAGTYGKNSFRGPSLEFRNRHFSPSRAGFKLHDRVRKLVTFQPGNLLADDFRPGAAPYDLIFCRNLLIYFDRATQGKVLRKLHRLLSPGGLLFVGPAELPLVAGNGFVTTGLPQAFACRQADSVPTSRENDAAPPAERMKPRLELSRSASGISTIPVTAPLPDLATARALADAGKLAAAREIGEAHLNAAGPSAPAYFLMGLVNDAAGDPAAMDYYRKALYLEPEHYETLLHLSLLLEKHGDAVGARTLKCRADRLVSKLI